MEFTHVVHEFSGVKLRYYVFGRGSPKILITAGLHGDEVTSVYAAFKLVEYLKFVGNLNGSVVVVPVVNVLGFQARMRVNPIDMVDLNRVFPDGSGSSITKGVVKKVWELASSSDYVIDLHCAGLYSYQYVLALYRTFPKVKEFTDKLDWDTIVESKGTRGQLFVEASYVNIPAVIIETVGGSGFFNEGWAQTLFNTLLNSLGYVGILQQDIKPIAKSKKYFSQLEEVRSTHEGFFKSNVDPGTYVNREDLIGEVDNHIIKAPIEGKVISLAKNRYVFIDDYVASIAPPA